MTEQIHLPEQPVGRLSDAWRHCVGTGRLELALRRDYQDSLALLQRDIGFRHIRGHGIFSDGLGIHRPYRHQGQDRVHHSFGYLDQVVDAYLDHGIQPFLELGFMPERMASGSQTIFWWRGNVTPPADHRAWAALVGSTLRHLVDRYGLETVRQWPVEVWNEPNLKEFWAGADQDAYHRLYETTVLAVKDVDPELQVGGPSLAPGYEPQWLTRFAEFTTARDLPVDFVSRHAYSSGPAQHVPFGVHQTLGPAQMLLDQFAAPREQLRGTALESLPVHITEFNSSYRPDNPIHDTAFQAAYLAPVLAGGGDLVDSFSYWTFSDMFEEEGVPTSLFHGGFGLLTHRQIKKPAYHLYAFMARLGPRLLSRGPQHLATRTDDGRTTVLAWAPVDHTGREPVDSHTLRLSVPVDPAARTAYLHRSTVGEDSGNARAAWTELGRPRSPKPRQLDLIREAAEPAVSHRSLTVSGGRVDIEITLGRHEVTLVELVPVTDDQTPEWWDETRLHGLGNPDGGDAA